MLETAWMGDQIDAGLPLELGTLQRALAVVAHPDDESFGLGGVLAFLTGRGIMVDLVCLTAGEASTVGAQSQLGAVRAGELQAAATALGIGRATMAGRPDGHLGALPPRGAPVVRLDGRDRLLALGAWLAWSWRRHHDHPATAWFLAAVAVSGVAAVAAMELGWITTEVGRQPWIVYHVVLVAQAVNPEPGVGYGVWAVGAAYSALTVILVAVLRHLARTPLPAAPQEADIAGSRIV